jgi:hypothetical protein
MKKDPNSYNPFRSNKWIDTLFDKAMSNPLTALLWTCVNLWIVFTVVLYIWADIMHWKQWAPEPTIKSVIKAQANIFTFEDAKAFSEVKPEVNPEK